MRFHEMCGRCGGVLHDPVATAVPPHLVPDPRGSNRHTCPGVGTVPWRRFLDHATPGPDLDTVLRHLGASPESDQLFARFDVRGGEFQTRVVARVTAREDVEFFVVAPPGPSTAPVAERLLCRRLHPSPAWLWRPVDFASGEPRAWAGAPCEWSRAEILARAREDEACAEEDDAPLPTPNAELRRLQEAVRGYAQLPTDAAARDHIRRHGGRFLVRLRGDRLLLARVTGGGPRDELFVARVPDYFTVSARTLVDALPFGPDLLRIWALSSEDEVVPLGEGPA